MAAQYSKVDKILVCGVPRSGKTTLSTAYESTHRVRHTDDLISLGWSKDSEAVVEWMKDPGPWLIEGIASIRALRKWMDRYPNPPANLILVSMAPWEDYTKKGQDSMAKGVRTVLDECLARWPKKLIPLIKYV